MSIFARYCTDFGDGTTQPIFAELPIALLCVGILTPLYGITIYTLMKHKGRSLQTNATLIIIFFSLLTSFGYVALQWTMQFGIIDCLFFHGYVDSTSVLCCSTTIMNVNPFLQGAAAWLSTLPLVFNDALIIWRAWVIFRGRRWALIITIGLCISCFAVTLAYLSSTATLSQLHDWSGGTPELDGTLSAMEYVFFGMSFLTNVVATSFIGWTLWKHVKFLREINTSHQRLNGAWRILALLLDSGAIYCILQLLMFGLQFSNTENTTNENFGYVVFASLYKNISCAYPSLTILLIHEVSSVEKFHNSIVALQTSQEHFV